MSLEGTSAEAVSSSADWSEHLRDCGLRRMRGQPLVPTNVAIPDEVVMSACTAFLEAVDAVLASAIAAPATVDAIEHALREHYLATAECVGVTLYLGPSGGEGLLCELIDEMDCARDALATMYVGHWAPGRFYAAVTRLDSRYLGRPSGFDFPFDRLSWNSPDERTVVLGPENPERKTNQRRQNSEEAM